MARKQVYGRVRYDEENDRLVYEIEYADGKWGLCMQADCVRREGAEDGEGTDFVSIGFLSRIIEDVMNCELRLVRE